MINELKLINRNSYDNVLRDTFFNQASDIEFDENGLMIKCTGEEGLEQIVLKSILTSIQLNGYGTSIFDLLGKKNTEFIRGKLMYEILSTFDTIRKNQLKYLTNFSTFDKKSIIARVFNIKSNKGKTDLQVSLKVQSLDKQIKNETSLDELTFNVTEND